MFKKKNKENNQAEDQNLKNENSGTLKQENFDEKAAELKDSQPAKKEEPELSNWQDQFLRVNADFQNYKRRVEKEKTEWMELAKVDVIKSFLSLVDELDLAIQSSEKTAVSDDIKAWLNGFLMIQKNLHKKLSELGVEKVDCSGQFDPNFHEALMQAESEDHKSGDIVQVFAPGYIYNDKVIRHAKVSVAK